MCLSLRAREKEQFPRFLGSRCKTHYIFVLFAVILPALCLSLPSAVLAEVGPNFTIKYFELKQGRLAFTHYANPKSKESNIYVIDFFELTVTPLVKNSGVNEHPSWSPDGLRLAYSSDKAGSKDIYVINADGSNERALTSRAGNNEEVDWSPDGKSLVFQSNRHGGGSSLYTMNADGSEQKPLAIKKRRDSGANSVPKWSPRGNEILYTSNEYWPGWDIMLFDIKEGKSKLLTNGNLSFSRGSWHPSGSSFLFSHGSGDNIDLWEFKKGADQIRPLISNRGRQYDPVWLDDESRLFFVNEKTPGENDFQILIWDKATSKISEVVSMPGAARFLSWTPLPLVRSLEEKAVP